LHIYVYIYMYIYIYIYIQRNSVYCKECHIYIQSYFQIYMQRIPHLYWELYSNLNSKNLSFLFKSIFQEPLTFVFKDFLLVHLRTRWQVFQMNMGFFSICNRARRALNISHTHGRKGGKDPYDALSGRSFFAKEPLIIGLFPGKWPVKIWHPMTLHHPVL